MVSNSAWPLISGGASWMTESPRSSVRQYNPASKSAEDTRPSSARRSSSVHLAQDGFDGVELGLAADQRRRQLDDGIAAVVGAAVQPGLEKCRGHPAEQRAAFVVGEGLLGRPVLDEFDAVEEALAAHVADDGQVIQLVEGGAEGGRVGSHVVVEALALEDVEVGQPDGRRNRMAAKGITVREHGGAVVERFEQPLAGDHGADRRVARRHPLGASDHVGHVAEVVAGGRPKPDGRQRYTRAGTWWLRR